MFSKSDKSGFVENKGALRNMLPAPRMSFMGSFGIPEKIPYVFYPALFQMNPRGLVAVIYHFDEMEDGQEIKVDWNSSKGTTTVIHPVQECPKHQVVGFTEEQALLHQGEQVTVTYTALIGAEPKPSLPSQFTIAKAELNLDELPKIEQLDVVSGVLQLKSIEAKGHACFRLPAIKGLHRGMYLSIELVGGSLQESVFALIKTTPDADLVFFVPYRIVEKFLDKEVACHYVLWFLENFTYQKSNFEDTFTVVL